MIKPCKIQHVSNLNKTYPYLSKVTWKPNAPYLALCGNIGDVTSKDFTDFIDCIARDYEKVVLVAGPIEYQTDMKKAEAILKGIETYIPNFHFLNDRSIMLDEHTKLIGSTMWPQIDSMSFMYDTHLSKVKLQGNYITPKKINELHMASKEFIMTSLQHNNNCIVVSHFNPSKQLNADATHSYIPKQAIANYASNLEYLFKPSLQAWICGAINMSDTIEINNIPLTCNNIFSNTV